MKLVTLVLLALVALATGVAYIAPETEDEVQSSILADMAHFDKSDVQSEIADEDSDDELELALTHADLDDENALSQDFDQDGTAEVQDNLVKGQHYRRRARRVTRRYRRPRQIIRRVRRIRPRQRVIIIRHPPPSYFKRMKHLKALLRKCKLRLQKVIALWRHRPRRRYSRHIIRRVTRRIRPRQRVIIIRRPPLRYFRRMKHLKALLRNCKLRLQKVIALLRHRRRYALRRRGRG